MNISKFLWAAAVTSCLVSGVSVPVEAQQQIVPDALVGIDHIPLAVNDLERAAATYRALGFTIKPGTVDSNGILTSLIKFPDGSGIELITASEAVDGLTEKYRQLLEAAEGPAFFAMHTRDTDKFIAALNTAQLDFSESDGVVEPGARTFDYLFFGRDNRLPTDRPEHFTHGNGATAMARVWIATDKSAELQQLLVTLGGEATSRTVYTPDKARAKVVAVTNGEIVILPKSHQLTKNRPIIGATFNVTDISLLERRLQSANIAFTKGGTENLSLIVAPPETHGMWLEFRE